MATATQILSVVLACLACAAVARADTTIPVDAAGRQVPVADISGAQSAPTARSSDPSVSEPDQTFSADHAGVNAQLGAHNGVPEDSATFDPNGFEEGVTETTSNPAGDLNGRVDRVTGRRMLQGRKLLGDLDLSGNGVSAGNDEAGVAARGYGHGVADDDAFNPNGVHIEPHGVEGTVTTAGTDTTVGGDANPDCLGNEGDCVGVQGK